MQLDASAVGEIDQCPSESVGSLIAPADDPVAVHPEVRVQRGAVVEMQQLVLPSSLDPQDSSLSQSSRLRGGKLSRQRGM